MILRGDIQQVENGVMTVQSLDTLHTIAFPEHHWKALQPFSQGDRVLIYLPGTPPVSRTAEYSEESRIFRDTFRYISDLRRDKYSDIIVLCTNFKPLVPTKGTDSLFSLGLQDHSGSIELKSFIRESDFRKFVAPEGGAVFSPGDILLLRNVKRGKLDNVAMIYKTCEITRMESIHMLDDEKRVYENLVAQSLSTDLVTQLVERKLLSPKTKRVEQVRDRSFFNVLGKVLYCDFDATPTVCITDFTTNTTAEPGTGLPPGNAILAIKLFGHHASLSTRIQLNRYYLFMNIRIHSFSPGLEAYMHDSLEGDVIPVESQELLSGILEAERCGSATGPAESTSLDRNSSDAGLQDCLLESCGRDNEESGDLRSGVPDVPSTSKQADACCEEREVLGVAKLSQIKAPGIFLCNCLIRAIEFLESAEGVVSRITVEEHSTLYDLAAKQKLTTKLLRGKSMLENRKCKFLVLRTGNRLFMVDLFANEIEYRNFESFYLSS
jgi:hypothetical protein